MILTEHTLFTIWGWYILIIMPQELGIDSWFFKPIDCWKRPIFPFPMFHLFYQVKVASHAEDLLNLVFIHFFAATDPKEKRDVKMDIHHLSTAALCIGSYVTNYSKIGSLGKAYFLTK
jgi:hypothetical protein